VRSSVCRAVHTTRQKGDRITTIIIVIITTLRVVPPFVVTEIGQHQSCQVGRKIHRTTIPDSQSNTPSQPFVQHHEDGPF